MLICGFEKFDNLFVRIDILERLFIQIISSNLDKKREIVLTSEMLNLLGCSKDNFIKLINKMNYKTFEKKDKLYFKYLPKSKKVFKKNKNIIKSNSPFDILKEMSFK